MSEKIKKTTDHVHAIVDKIQVRYGETDQMGHAYYGSYALWLEQARGTLFRKLGKTVKEIEQENIKFPAVELNIKYIREIKYDDIIAVKVWIEEITRAAVLFKYTIFNETTEEHSCEAYSWHVAMGKERKAITIPDDLRKILQSNPNKS